MQTTLEARLVCAARVHVHVQYLYVNMYLRVGVDVISTDGLDDVIGAEVKVADLGHRQATND